VKCFGSLVHNVSSNHSPFYRLLAFVLIPKLCLRKRSVQLALAGILAVACTGAQACGAVKTPQLTAPQDVRFEDVPNDDGSALLVKWHPGPDSSHAVQAYEVFLSTVPSDSFVSLATVASNETQTKIQSGELFIIHVGTDYYCKVAAIDSFPSQNVDTLVGSSPRSDSVNSVRKFDSAVVGPFQTRASWFNAGRTNVFVLILVFYGLVLFMVRRARRGSQLRFRRIAGIDAIDEAIGRATELGKPVLYVPGTQDIDNIQTIASLQMLTSVATKAATYDIPIVVPLNRAFMVSVAEEAVKQGYLNAGRVDAYNRDNIRYLSDEQFAFTSGVTGIMMREKTAAHLFLGSFFAESLILSETGYSTGAIQIAGTANIHQLPFFVVACDYTLIGEEYFATSGLVTRNPELLGTLKATDWVKTILIGAILAAAGLGMFGVTFIRSLFAIP
jgi:hypothetical protein